MCASSSNAMTKQFAHYRPRRGADAWTPHSVIRFNESGEACMNVFQFLCDLPAAILHIPVVGTDQLSESGYFRAKIAQEKLIRESPMPYTIVHATPFFEFVKGLADISMVSGKVHLPHVLFQPVAADDVATAAARIAVGPAVNGIVEIGGPEQFRLDELVRRRLATLNDPREVIADPNALYSGAKIGERTLVPGKDARLGETRFETWLKQSAGQNPQTGKKAAAVIN